MKKLPTILLTIFLLFSYTSPILIHAQEDIVVEEEIQQEQPKETLSETLQKEEVEEVEVVQEKRSFVTIFLSLLIPSFLIIIAYLIFKFFEF